MPSPPTTRAAPPARPLDVPPLAIPTADRRRAATAAQWRRLLQELRET